MLIRALCDYYDILSAADKVLPPGYSKVKVHYLVALTAEGEIDEILPWKDKTEVPAGKGKKKWKEIPKEVVMMQRTEKPGIDANIVEHRPVYLFGLHLDKDRLTAQDSTNKAKKSHELFVKENLEFLNGLNTPLICAFRNFLLHWNPEQQTENRHLLQLGKEYEKAGYVFCLSGSPELRLHEEPALRQKWEICCKEKENASPEDCVTQCAVSGEAAPIARIHNKIKGVYGGLATGSVLIGFNNPSENSYGNDQSYNSNISVTAMKKYTEALNYLLASRRHRVILDDMTVVFWAMNPKETCEDLFEQMLLEQPAQLDAEDTENMLKKLVEDANSGYLTRGRLSSLDLIQPDVDFYMLGLKPNSSRLSVKFLIRRKYADILWNVVRFQQDLQITKEVKPVYLSHIRKELISPKSKNDKVNPALLAGLFEAILYGTDYPNALLETMVRRIRVDGDRNKINDVRVGVIKACLNRKGTKEEIKVALDKENNTQAYLCGRLFAILERLQQDASNYSLNRTIRDAYFASASTRPVLVFPKIIKLANQSYLKKVKYPTHYNKLIGEVMQKLNGGFPDQLSLKEQGEFIVGYYQQNQAFFEKKNQEETEE